MALIAAVLAFSHAAPAADMSATPLPATTLAPSPAPAARPPLAILDVVFSPEPLQAGKPVSLVVHTTPDAIDVQGRVLAYTFSVPKTGDGEFSGHGGFPWWARFYHGSFRITFTARDGAGGSAHAVQDIRL